MPLLDSCRAVAALSVLAYHVGVIRGGFDGGPLGQIGGHLNIGVPLFFLLSGLLLYRPFVTAREKSRSVNLRRYATRRVLRIVPAYWVALTVLAVGAGLPGVLSGDWWRYYGFLQIYDRGSFDKGLAVAWTLCIEVTFYALLPLYAFAVKRFTRRRETVLLVALGSAALAFRAAVGEPFARTLPGTFMWFVPGMLLALYAPKHAPAWAWPAAVAVFLASCFAPDLASDVLVMAVGVLFVLPAIAGGNGLPQRVLGWAPLLWIGTVSYAVYLYHAILMAWLHAHGAGSWPMLAISSLTVTLIAAAASWYFVERPALRSTWQWLRPRRAQAAQA